MKELNVLMIIACIFSAITLSVIGILEGQVFQQAAQTECARYHPETGDFEWLDKQGELR